MILTPEQLFKPRDERISAPEATYTHPLTLLKSCHEKIRHFSSALVKLSEAISHEDWSENSKASAGQIRRYFNIAAPEHHRDEELHLFPAIIALDPKLENPAILAQVNLINQMVKEHVETDALWEKLDSMLEQHSCEFDQLYAASSLFAANLTHHADIEDNEIFSFAEQHINKSTFEKMGKAIAKRRGIKLKR